MQMAGTIAGGMMAAMDPGKYTLDDGIFVSTEATHIAYAIAHKVLDDSLAAEYEEFLGIAEPFVDEDDGDLYALFEPEFSVEELQEIAAERDPDDAS
jgi:hypothetical protein